MLIFRAPFILLGVLFMSVPVFINQNDLTAFYSSDAFGFAIILAILVATALCIILGRGRSE